MRLANPLADLKPSDRARFAYSLVGFVCVAAAALVARTAGDALFLSNYGADLLSYMYVATAAVVIAAAYVLGTLSTRVALHRLITWSCTSLCVLFIVLLLLRRASWAGAPILAYLLADLVVNVPMILFWSHAGLLFNPREAKRLFGFIGAGGTAGCIAAGFAVPRLSSSFGDTALFYAVCALLLGFVMSSRRLAALEPPRVMPDRPAARATAASHKTTFLQRLWGVPQLRNLTALVLAASVTLTLVDFQFKASARAYLPADGLAGFFGTFYGGASILALLIQLFAVHRILKRGGVFVALALLPVGLIVTSAGAAAYGSFAWIVAMKFVVQVLLFTIDVAALQLLYLGVPSQTRPQAKAFVDGIAKPAAMAATGGGLVVLVGVAAPQALAMTVIVGAVVWLALARKSHGAYVKALVGSLDQKRYDPGEDTMAYRDESFENHLREALATGPDDEIVYLLQIMEEMPHVDWSETHRQLLARESPEVKVASLGYLGRHGTQEDLQVIQPLLAHTNPEVRSGAVAAAARLGSHTVIDEVQFALNDDSPLVKGAAVTGLINAGDLDGLLAAGAVLRDLLASPDVESRTAAARALGGVQDRGLTRPLMGLLEDADPGVVLEALDACARRRDPQLIAAVLPLLAQQETRDAAARTLRGFGHDALPHLLPYLQLGHADGAFSGASRVPDILAAIGDPSALPALHERILDRTDPAVQESAVRAYCDLVKNGGLTKAQRGNLDAAVEAKLSEAEQLNGALRDAVEVAGAEVLTDALRHERNRRIRSMFLLLDLQVSDVDLIAVHASLESDSDATRANALEILDNVLRGELKTRVMGILERPGSGSSDRSDASQRIAALMAEDADEWVTAGAIYAAAQNGWVDTRKHLGDLVRNPSPTVRETALYALGRFGPHPTLSEAREQLASDPVPRIREQARMMSDTQSEGQETL